jgi:hypothetical protein
MLARLTLERQRFSYWRFSDIDLCSGPQYPHHNDGKFTVPNPSTSAPDADREE